MLPIRSPILVTAAALASCHAPTPPPIIPPVEPALVTTERPPARFLALTAGRAHACVVESSGRVVCWGDDSHGQLGDGPPSPLPAGASCFPPAAGKEPPSEEARTAGARYCVSYRAFRSTPVVVGLGGFVSVAAGERHTCGIRRDRSVYCWGDNTSRQLGVSDYADHVGTPLRVPVIDAADEIVAGGAHTCARTGQGPWRCWGENTPTSPTPFEGWVSAEERARLPEAALTAVGAGFACIAGDSGLQCIGRNEEGQLGGGRSPHLLPAEAPGPVLGIEGAQQVDVTHEHACALRRGGRVSCWGDANLGVLGSAVPDGGFVTTPIEIASVTDAVEVRTSDFRTCIRHRSGAIDCYDESGAHVPGTQPTAIRPIAPRPLTGEATDGFAIGSTHACWIRPGGALACEGSWEHGTAPIPSFDPKLAGQVRDVRALIADAYRTCALRAGGAITCFGDRFAGFHPPRPYGQMPTWRAPVEVAAEPEAVEVAMGEDWLCARTAKGVIRCPVVHGRVIAPRGRAPIATDAVSLADGPCFARADGALACADLSTAPPTVTAIAGIAEVASASGTCTVRRDGSVWCWGSARLSGRGGVARASGQPVPVLLPP